MARSSFTFSGSPFTRTGSGFVPSEGKKVTLTLVGSMVGAGAPVEDGRSETEPVAAKIRPQLVGEKKKKNQRVVTNRRYLWRTLHLLRKEPF